MNFYSVKKPEPNADKNIILKNQLVTIGDLQDFKIQLLKDIRQLLSQTSVLPNKPWLKSGEVRKLLKISSGTLQTLRSNGTLRSSKVGGTIYYQYEDIESMIRDSQ